MSRSNVAGRGPTPGLARRWPDLMIGVLIVLLLGGFGALLLRDSGPSATVAAETQTESTSSAAEAEIPAAPGTEGVTVTPPGESAETTTATTAPVAAEPAATTTAEAPAPAASGTTAPAATTPAATETQPGADPVAAAPLKPAPAPAEPEKSEVPSATTLPAQPAAPVTPPASLETGTSPAATSSSSASPTAAVPSATPAANAVPATEQRTPLRSDYRISLGSFTTEQTVRTQTAGVSGLGYTVHPIDLGGEFVAQVGPYADEATARRALADIRRAFPSAVLYPPRGVSLTGETAPAVQPSPAQTPATRTPATQPPAVQPPVASSTNAGAATPAPPLPVPTTAESAATPAASSPTYLQVGAFDRVESAQTLVEQLRGEDFAPSVNAPEGRKVTVLVGPFSGPALADAESKLSAAGHDSFRVR